MSSSCASSWLAWKMGFFVKSSPRMHLCDRGFKQLEEVDSGVICLLIAVFPHPQLHMSMAGVYRSSPSSSSGGRYHSVITLLVYGRLESECTGQHRVSLCKSYLLVFCGVANGGTYLSSELYRRASPKSASLIWPLQDSTHSHITQMIIDINLMIELPWYESLERSDLWPWAIKPVISRGVHYTDLRVRLIRFNSISRCTASSILIHMYTILSINTSSRIYEQPLIWPAQRKHASWMSQTKSGHRSIQNKYTRVNTKSSALTGLTAQGGNGSS